MNMELQIALSSFNSKGNLRVNRRKSCSSRGNNKTRRYEIIKVCPIANGGAGDLCQVVDPRSETVISSSVDIVCSQINERAVRRVHEPVAEVIGKVGVVPSTPGVDQTRDDGVNASIGEAKE